MKELLEKCVDDMMVLYSKCIEEATGILCMDLTTVLLTKCID